MATIPDEAGPRPPRRDGHEAALCSDLKEFMVRHLRLRDVDPGGLDDDAPLIGGGLDLDSIDVLELVTGVEKRYKVRFEDPDLVKQVFRSVRSIAGYLAARRGGG